jgi:glycosyltransferase involved in cell wall biosynthesis
MRIAVIAGVVPNPDSGGGAITAWSVIRHLLGAGHEVAAVCVHDPVYDDAAGRTLEQRLEQVRGLGAKVHAVPSRARTTPMRRIAARAWRPRDEELLPNLLDAPAVAEAVAGLGPDAVFTYGWDAVAASRGLRGRIPRFATVVDPAHLPELYRFRRDPKRLDRGTLGRALLLQAMLRRLPRLQVELLNECEAAADVAAHHAEWLRRKGARHCLTLRTPVQDRPGAGWRERRRAAGHDRPRILLIGHLRGTSTLDGLDVFAKRILPRIERELGPDAFEVRLAGGFELPPDLEAALDRPSVRLLGHLPEPDEELASADVLLVPTSVPLGARVRIVTGLSYGCPMVIHQANALGIPELEHGRNALLGRTPDELAAHTLEALRDADLRHRLEERGRETYERFFALPVAGKAVEDVLVGIRQGSPPPPA